MYGEYNRREYVHPDPLEFLYHYPGVADREVAAMVASSLAFGRVTQIIKSVRTVLERMKPSPAGYLALSGTMEFTRDFADFRHRFVTGRELAGMLAGMKRIVEDSGTLNRCFADFLGEQDETVLEAARRFAAEIRGTAQATCDYLIPSPRGTSACKRMNLFLRWMVRTDTVDPGGWAGVSPSKLIVPLDTHMFRICRALGFTGRKQADMRAALEVTAAFREIAPLDPVRYDFALTRLGIRGEPMPAALSDLDQGQ